MGSLGTYKIVTRVPAGRILSTGRALWARPVRQGFCPRLPPAGQYVLYAPLTVYRISGMLLSSIQGGGQSFLRAFLVRLIPPTAEVCKSCFVLYTNTPLGAKLGLCRGMIFTNYSRNFIFFQINFQTCCTSSHERLILETYQDFDILYFGISIIV